MQAAPLWGSSDIGWGSWGEAACGEERPEPEVSVTEPSPETAMELDDPVHGLVSWEVRVYPVYRQVVEPASKLRNFRGAISIANNRSIAREADGFTEGWNKKYAGPDFKASAGSFACQ